MSNIPQYIPLAHYGEHRRAVSAVSFAGTGGGYERNSSMQQGEGTMGAILASASADATVKIWEVKPKMVLEARRIHRRFVKQEQANGKNDPDSKQLSGEPIHHTNGNFYERHQSMTPLLSLVGHSRGINDVAWSQHPATELYENSASAPPPPYIATASDDKSLRLWDVQTGDPLVEFRGHANFVFSVKFNPQSSNLLVSGSFDETVKLWDVRSGECVSTLPAHSDPVTGVDFNRDGSCIVSGSHDGLVRIWDTATGECLKTLYAEGNHPPVSYVGYSPNGRFVLAGTLDSKLRLWDVTTKYHPAATSSTLLGLGSATTTDGSALSSSSYRKPSTLRCTKIYAGGHVNSKFCTFAAFAIAGPLDRQYVVTGSEDGLVYLYGLQSRKVVQVLDCHGSTTHGNGDNSTGANKGQADVSSTNPAPNTNTNTNSQSGGPVLAVAAHSKQEMLASGGMTQDKTVKVWVPAWITSPEEHDVDMDALVDKPHMAESEDNHYKKQRGEDYVHFNSM